MVAYGQPEKPLPSPPAYPRVPYGEADFRRIRLNSWLYVDKTRFLRPLEDERYAFLIRPRRFGKSCWVSLLENYYDRRWKDEFEAVFGGTDVGREPTPERHRYVVLRYDFSAVNDKLETLEQEFEMYCFIELRGALERNPDLFPKAALQRILAPPSIAGKLTELFRYCGDHDIPLYVLIDEYDNFANTILAYHGEEAYEELTHGGGFFRNFFATLKAGAGKSGGGVERLFITGVSPIAMDDVTSGFNIGTNLSLSPAFNEVVGFTEAETRQLVDIYHERGVLGPDPDEAMALMREWYNGYRFAERSETDVYNTDMVLYYLKYAVPNQPGPRDLIDVNVRIDYGKLRHLLVTGQRLNGNFDQLRRAIADGQADSRIEASFPVKELNRRENFLSLMHYFGLLSIRGQSRGVPRLGVPNQTVRRLTYGHLRDAFQDAKLFSVDFYAFETLMSNMAYDGEWRAAVEHLADAMARQTGIRDYIDGERVVQTFLAAHFALTDHYVMHSEWELNKGYADLYLEPRPDRFPGMAYGYVLEIKYLRRGEGAGDEQVAKVGKEAMGQLSRYLADAGIQSHPVRHVGIAMVFRGWELVFCEAVEAQ